MIRSSTVSPHMLGFDFRFPEVTLLVVAIASNFESEETLDFGWSSWGFSGVATPKNVATASQELLSRDGSALDFAGSGTGDTVSSTGTVCSNRDVVFSGFAGPSVFFAVGPSEGVLSRFAMLFQ